MAGTTLMSILADLLKRISTTLAHAAHTEEALCEIVQSVGKQARLELIRLSVQNPHRGTSHAATYEQSGSFRQTGVAMNRELRFNSLLYGHIEILASKPAARAIELYQFVETLEAILLNYSIVQSRAAERSRLRSSLLILQEEVRSRKLAARAQSLLANYGFGSEAANEYLEQESRRSSIPMTVAAERLIAQERRRSSEAA